MNIIDYSGNSNSASDVGSGNRPTPALRHPSLRCAQTGEQMVNRAVSGSMAQDQAWAGVNVIRANTATKFVIICDINDVRLMSSARADRYQAFLRELACQSVLSDRKSAASAAVTKSGTWLPTQVLPGKGMHTATIGASASATIIGSAVYISVLVDNHLASQGSVASVYDGSTKIGQITSDNTGVNLTAAGHTYNGLRYGPACFRFEVPAGQHQITLINETPKNLYLISIAGNEGQIDSPDVLVGNGYRLPVGDDGGYTIPAASYETFRLAAEAAVQEMAADGFNVKTLNTFAHQFARMPDRLHWSEEDHAWVADEVTRMFLPPTDYAVSYPMDGGGTLTIHFNAAGQVQSYSQTP